MGYFKNLNTLRKCQLHYDNMNPPEYYDDDCDEFITQDEIDEARLELAIERQEAELNYDEGGWS